MTVNKWDSSGMIKIIDVKKRNRLIAELNLEESEREANSAHKKRRLKLSALEGNANCFLQIEMLPNGDMYVGIRGQDTLGNVRYIDAQIPSPINGGGNMDDYKILVKMYDVLKGHRNKK